MKTDFKAYASLLSAEPTDAEVIATWLRDHEADAESKTMEVDETIQESESVAAESEAYDTHLAVSQIRILSKRYTTEPDVVPFVAVIDKWDEEMWLIVPFSPYKTPATPSEMTTGLNMHGLRVLQTWNTRTVQGEILKNSYLFGTLPDKVRKNALCLFRRQMFGMSLPEDFEAQCGVPIIEAADPRRDYLEECMARLKPLSRAVIELAEGTTDIRKQMIDILFDKYLSHEDSMKLAAATDDDAGRILVLMKKDAWDAMVEGRDASDFCGYSTRDGGQKTIIAYLNETLPQGFDGFAELPIVACEKNTRAIVGTGVLTRQIDGRCKIKVRLGSEDEAIKIQNVRDLVLIVQDPSEETSGKER